MNEIRPLPIAGTIWRHLNGNLYKVLMIANSELRNDNYPVTVVYQNVDNGTVWCRRADDWHRSMTEMKP